MIGLLAVAMVGSGTLIDTYPTDIHITLSVSEPTVFYITGAILLVMGIHRIGKKEDKGGKM